MKHSIIFFFILFLAACNSKNPGFKITGLTSNLPDSTKIYLTDINASLTFDSTIVVSNKFTFKGKVDSIKSVVIHTYYFHDFKSLWIDNANILLDARHSNLRKAKISGSQFQDLNSRYTTIEDSWRMKSDSIDKLISITSKTDSIFLKCLFRYEDSISLLKQKLILEFIQTNPDFCLNGYNLTFLMLNQPKQVTAKMFNAMSQKRKNDKWGKAVKIYIDKANDFKIGDTANDFTLPDINGNPISLSSFKRKYVLLEFWASWCGHCRAENPNLIKVYHKYQKYGFEILGVSLDEQKEVWQTTIKTDTIMWTTVSDLKGYLGEVPITYKIDGIPKNYLIDPTGKIIDIDLRGISLENKLRTIFKN